VSTSLPKLALRAIGVLVASCPLLAHHDWPVDRSMPITVTGTVTAYSWANPHVTIGLAVEANGTIEKWTLGGSSPQNLAAQGWDKHTLKPGDVITGIGYRFRNGSTVAQMQRIVLAGGKEMYLYPGLLPR
jgi:hypothetical protein